MDCNIHNVQLIKASSLFDSQWYLEQYPDVSVLGLDAAEHYLRFGGSMQRNPSPQFDAVYYLAKNPDVAVAGINPLAHYLTHGIAEGRSARPLNREADITVSAGGGDVERWLALVEPLLQAAPGRLGIAERTARRPALRGAVAPSSLAVAWVINQHDKMTHQYRVRNYIEALPQHGIHPLVLSERDLLECDLAGVDILVLCRLAATPAMLRVIDEFRATGKSVVFDIDDLVFDPDRLDLIRHVAMRSDADCKAFRGMQANLRDTMWRSDLVTVSTYALKTEVERFGKPALVLPNNISLKHESRAADLVARAREAKGKRIRIGYFSGTKSHEHDFAECAEGLFRVMQERKDVELMVVGWLDAAERFRVFQDRFVQLPVMSHDQMMEQLATTDINLAPLETRNPFTQCKSELKIFEAALYEIPTIASPTASYAATIIHRRNGVLADGTELWRHEIRRLVDNPDMRLEIGKEARRTIASRFMVSSTVHEAVAILRAVKGKRTRPRAQRSNPPMQRQKPAISIISILYKKREEVTYFLESMRRQSFDRPYEIVLVDDVSPDDSVAVVEEFARFSASMTDTNPNMSVRIIRNENNLGNCTSRNRAIQESSGEIIIVVDADCVFNRDFLASHFLSHKRGKCDVAVGPKGIETNGRPPISVLGIHDADPTLAVSEARPQDGINQDSFVNCVTRNFSVRRSFIEQALEDGKLFDDIFNYSANPDSGFGWEDVEMGCRLYTAGARIKFLPDTVSIHVSHPPAVENRDKPFRSLKNFRRLHEKHPQLHLESRQWTRQTYEAITKWCQGVGGDLENNEDYQFLQGHFEKQRKAPVVFTKPKSLRVLTFRWHCPHQYELYRIGHDFTLVTGLGTGICDRWEWAHRPLPANARLMSHTQVDPRDYDVAILHFDENLLHPELCHGKVPADWAKTCLRALADWDLPKVAVCHGTPQFRGQYDIEYDQPDLGAIIEESRVEMVEALSEVTVVCNSHQASNEWRFKKGRTIWHGFSPHDFPPNMRGEGAYAMSSRALANRPHYNGHFVMKSIVESLGGEIPIDHLSVGDPSVAYPPRTVEWAKVKFENYVRAVGKYGIYVNPTVRSPMPRTRGEAMMAGVSTVSLRNHDVDMFIQNGVNGFYADEPEELADQIRFLANNQSARKKMGDASRRTALDVFNQDRYLSAWAALLKDVTG